MKQSFLSADMKVIILPGLYLLILLFLFYFVGKTGWEKINEQRKNLTSSKKIESTLLDKYNTLSQSQSHTDPYIDSVTIALSEKNPALMIVSQLRSQTEGRGIQTDDLKIGSAATSAKETSELTVSFKMSGDLITTLEFLDSMASFSPIVTVEKLSLSNFGGIASSEISLKSYWSKFPEKLPGIADPINKITETDLAVLTKTRNLTPPQFTNLSPQGPYIRTTPF